MYNWPGVFMVGILAFCTLGVIFIVLRAVMLWYWRINQIVERLDAIIAELKNR